MSSTSPQYLPDVNLLLALSDGAHDAHRVASAWFSRLQGARLVLCPVTEAGFVRLSANPQVGGRAIEVAVAMLQAIKALPNCSSCFIDRSWMELVTPFVSRLQGYRQVTDALLLGLAIRHKYIFVTLDQRVSGLAGSEFSAHLLVLV